MEEFTPTEEVQGTEIVETTEETASSGLEIIVPKVVPDVIVINGVETSADIIAKLKEEVLAMKVDGIEDEKGFNDAEEKLKLIAKTRTTSEKWRKNFFDPYIKFKKAVDQRFKDDAVEYELMETHLESQLTPVRDAIKIAREKAELAKDKLGEDRAAEIIAMGGVFDGKGTYNFEHDAGYFILHDKLRNYTEDQYQVEIKDIKESWEAEKEKKRLADEADEAERLRVLNLANSLNDKRTALRRKELKLEGYKSPAPGIYENEAGQTVTEEDILNMEDEQWDDLLAGVVHVEDVTEEIRSESPVASPETQFAGIADDFEPEEDFVPAAVETPTELPKNVVADAGSYGGSSVKSEPVIETSETKATKYNFMHTFTDQEPSIQVNMDGAFIQLVYPAEYESIVLKDRANIALTGTFHGGLLYALIKQ